MRRPAVMRWFIVIAGGAVLLLTVALAARASATDPVVTLIHLPVALALGWFGWSMLTTKAPTVMFDGERLVDDSGVELCALDEIETVERGFALFKPSGGFALLLNVEKPRGWSPGLWWRFGRRVGIGGATPGRSGRNMADAITMAITLRNASDA